MTPSSTALNTMTTTKPTRPERRALWIPGIFVGFMLVVFAVNGTLIYFAEHTFSGLDTDKYYEEGVQYNAVMKEGAASAALGWTAKPEFVTTGTTTAAPTTAGVRHLQVRITDKAGQPVTGLHVLARLVRHRATGVSSMG